MNELFRDPQPLIRRVYAYVAYRIGDGPAAEDATSATFERALRYRNSFDPRKGDLAAWLIGIARRVLAETPRPEVLVAEPPERATPEDLAATAVERLALRRAVATLSPRDRELIALRYGSDFSARRIGELLGLRTNAVEVALHRALERLRAAVGEEDVKSLVRSPAPARY